MLEKQGTGKNMTSKLVDELTHPKNCKDKKKQFAIVVGSACGVAFLVGVGMASGGAATRVPIVSQVFLITGVLLVLGAIIGLGVGFGYEYPRVCKHPTATVSGPSGSLYL
jgi:hypothetical protein